MGMAMTDALAGYRRQINERKVAVLRFPASKPCPVEPGQHHSLQSCVIEIESVHRKIIKGKEAEWHVTFIRHEPDHKHFLRQSPPVHASSEQDANLDLSKAERARRDGNYTGTTYSAMPNEPESVGPDWEDKRAPERELQRQEERRARVTAQRNDAEVDKLAARVKQVGKQVGRNGVDLTPALADIYERLAKLERDAA
jgi:hypothetical protein